MFGSAAWGSTAAAGGFQPNTVVSCRNSIGCWYDARIAAANSDGTYNVIYLCDGTPEQGVFKDRLKKLQDYSQGEAVDVTSDGGHTWTDAQIVSKTVYTGLADGTFEIKLADGKTEPGVKRARLRAKATVARVEPGAHPVTKAKAKAHPKKTFADIQPAGAGAAQAQSMTFVQRGKEPKGPGFSVGELLTLLIIPFLLFSATCCLFAFAYERFSQLVWLWFFVALFASVMAYRRLKGGSGAAAEMLPRAAALSVIAGAAVGLVAYDLALQSYSFYETAYEYVNVLPSNNAKGYGDAGMIVFAEEAHLDTSRTMGYKDTTTYCVAPILDDEHVATVQFWAAGMNCCNQRGGFVCDDAWDSKARAGMVIPGTSRVMGDVRLEYMKAVRQAEAAYGIASAEEPIFVQWVVDPEKVHNIYMLIGVGILIVANTAYCVAACTSLAFLRSGKGCSCFGSRRDPAQQSLMSAVGMSA